MHEIFSQRRIPISSSWYREHAHEMTPDVIRARIKELGAISNDPNLANIERLEIGKSVKVLTDRWNEVIPHIPAPVNQHDKVNRRGRAESAWPVEMPKHTLYVHLHFSELVDDWRIHPHRNSLGNISVNEVAEHAGKTVIDFDSERDLSNFVECFSLHDFIMNAVSYKGDGGNVLFQLELRNRFNSSDASTFIDALNGCMNRLAIISTERERANRVDGGRIGLMSVDHFHAREEMQLNHILHARLALGKSVESNRR